MIINFTNTVDAMEVYMELLSMGIDVEYYQNSGIREDYGWPNSGALDDLAILDLMTKIRDVVIYDGNILDLQGNRAIIRDYVLKNKNFLIFVPPLSRSGMELTCNLRIHDGSLGDLCDAIDSELHCRC